MVMGDLCGGEYSIGRVRARALWLWLGKGVVWGSEVLREVWERS